MTDEEKVEFEDVKAIHASELALCCLIDERRSGYPRAISIMARRSGRPGMRVRWF
jgi:hypothetical protein